MARSKKTNDAYAIAKIAGIKMCTYNSQYGLNYKSIMPTNLYGPGDNYDLNNSHVIPAIIRKTHEAIINKEDSITVGIWKCTKRYFMLMISLKLHCAY